MKLLICTQKIDKFDPILGFFHDWVIEFSKHCEKVTVICLNEGVYDFPANVKVLSLGKEKGNSRLDYIRSFYGYIRRERKNYDAVFVHMNQVYVVLGAILWRLWGKKIGLWYVHRSVSSSLRVAVFLVNDIFTASPETFTIKSAKNHIVGHGINIENFINKEGNRRDPARLSITSVGRITRIKNLETLIGSCALLRENGMNFSCEIVGPMVTEDDRAYFKELQSLIEAKNLQKDIIFAGAVPPQKIREYFWKSDITINLAPTGGIDKAVIEGIAAGNIPFASNVAFVSVFGPYAKNLIFEFGNSTDLAQKIMRQAKNPAKEAMLLNLQKKVEIDFSLPGLVEKIMGIYAHD